MNKKDKVKEILKLLGREYGNAECTLEYETPLQLLIATCLAAQCTDARVNIVTKELFLKYRNVNDFANANQAELEQDIKSTGFYKNKAKNIISACNTMLSNFNGNVPDNMDDLLTLAGVGRKTANLILGEIFGKRAIVVDTHCTRLTNRIGLTKNKDATKIEFDLGKIIEPKNQLLFCHLMVAHGRSICRARNPLCDKCGINFLCNFRRNGLKD